MNSKTEAWRNPILCSILCVNVWQTSAWHKCIQVTLELKEVKRQSDQHFIKVLQAIRLGRYAVLHVVFFWFLIFQYCIVYCPHRVFCLFFTRNLIQSQGKASYSRVAQPRLTDPWCWWTVYEVKRKASGSRVWVVLTAQPNWSLDADDVSRKVNSETSDSRVEE